MRRIAFFLVVLAAGTPAFVLTPWETGQWVNYADVDGTVAATVSLVELPERSEGQWLQVNLMLPGMGWIVLAMALVQGGAEFIQGNISEHVQEPGAEEEIFRDFDSLLAYYGNFGGEIILGMDTPEMEDRMVISLTPEMLGEFLSLLGEFGENYESAEPAVFETEEDVEVEVPAGAFTCTKISSESGEVWYADEVPLFGVARVSILDESGETDVVIELTDYGSSGATDALDGWPEPQPIESFLSQLISGLSYESGQSYESYTDQDALANKKPR